MMRYLHALVFLCCCTLFSCTKDVDIASNYSFPTPISGRTYSADEVTAFKQLTFNAMGRLIKLPPQASVYLVDTTYPYLTRELDAIIGELNTLLDSNLVIKRTTSSVGANIEVRLTDRDTYIQHEPETDSALRNSNYTGYAYADNVNSGIIEHCGIFVDMSRTRNDTLQQRYIMHHEMMHALGFMGHVTLPQIYTVMFNYTLMPYVLDYTLFDKKMMLLLYNPAVTPQTSEADFNQIVKNL